MTTPKYTEIITRRREFDNTKVWATSISIKNSYDEKWSNCLYLHFKKSEFPNLNYPKVKKTKYSFGNVYNYMDSFCSEVECHFGVTFYEEVYYPVNGETYIKFGCDYQHYRDEHYMSNDCGDLILFNDADDFLKNFLLVVERSNNDHTKI